jgi:hypothetical protein
MDTVMTDMKQPKYDDDYSTCAETYSTLRVFADEVNPVEITKALGIVPTKSFQKGEPHSNVLFRKTHGWFYSTAQLTPSKDTRRHIDLILEVLNGKGEVIEALRQRGCKLDIMSYWVSHGQGGPALWSHQMFKLGTLGIEVWWDIYFADKDET